MEENFDVVIIGGGIAGISCLETFLQSTNYNVDYRVAVISASGNVKVASNVCKISKLLEEFQIKEKPFDSIYPNVKFIRSKVLNISSAEKLIVCSDSFKIGFKKLCLCTGGRPNLISSNPRVIGIRDTESVVEFQKRLANSKRVLVVGNGGIAIELVHELNDVDVIWAIKHDSIGNTFFDPGAAEFFLPRLHIKSSASVQDNEIVYITRRKYTTEPSQPSASTSGSRGTALGPDWLQDLDIKGTKSTRRVHVEYCVEVNNIYELSDLDNANLLKDIQSPFAEDLDAKNWPVFVQLSNGKIFGCDIVVSATGVAPDINYFIGCCPVVASDGGLVVDCQMRCKGVSDIYAAGDACTVDRSLWPGLSKRWFQMRLWTQARHLGSYAGRCIGEHLLLGDNHVVDADFSFELFNHVTQFFGYKVILFGLYNSQGMSVEDYYLLLRMTPNEEYIKAVMDRSGRMQGAVIIGDTDIEETLEHLILMQMDLSNFGVELLDPNIDIGDYFD